MICVPDTAVQWWNRFVAPCKIWCYLRQQMGICIDLRCFFRSRRDPRNWSTWASKCSETWLRSEVSLCSLRVFRHWSLLRLLNGLDTKMATGCWNIISMTQLKSLYRWFRMSQLTARCHGDLVPPVIWYPRYQITGDLVPLGYQITCAKSIVLVIWHLWWFGTPSQKLRTGLLLGSWKCFLRS